MLSAYYEAATTNPNTLIGRWIAEEQQYTGATSQQGPREKFEAHYSQWHFAKSLNTKYQGFSGPVGSGKTAALAFRILDLADKNRGLKGFIGAPTHPMLTQALLPAILDACDQLGVKRKLVMGGSNPRLEFPGWGVEAFIRSLEKPDHIRGSTVAWFAVDELTYCKVEAWERLEARLRGKKGSLIGIAGWTPKGFDWVYDRFIDERRPDRLKETCSAVRALPGENLAYCGPDYYEDLRATYDAEFFQQEALGQYLNIQTGRAYYGFNQAVHVSPIGYGSDRALWIACDFNIDPMAWVIGQTSGSGRGLMVQVLDEITLRDANVPQACEELWNRIERITGGHNCSIDVYGDSAGNNRSHAGTTSWKAFRDFFVVHSGHSMAYHVPRAAPLQKDRVALVNGLFRNSYGESRVLIDPRCKELIKDFERVGWVKGGSAAIDKDDKARTHWSDAFGYMACQAASTPAGARTQRII